MTSPHTRILQGSFLPSASTAQRSVSLVASGSLIAPASPGRPLPAVVQTRMSALFGRSFSDVRVHVGQEAPRLRAVAFAMGTDLYFAPGRYQPETPDGLRLLAHELTHVVQQQSGRVPVPSGRGTYIVRDPALEAEADRMGQRVLAPQTTAQGGSSSPAHVLQRQTTGVIQRWPPEGTGGGLNLDPWPVLSLDAPIVRVWTPTPQVRLSTPPTPLPQPVRLFDITGRNLSGIPLPPPVYTIPPVPPPSAEERQRLRDEIDADLERMWRASEEKDVRNRYQEVHARLVDLKYKCLAQIGEDLTRNQTLLLDGLLGLIATGDLARGRVLLGASPARRQIDDTLKLCAEWAVVVDHGVDCIAPCLKVLREVDEIVEQLTNTYETRENLYKRRELGGALEKRVDEWDGLKAHWANFRKFALACDSTRPALRLVERALTPLGSLSAKVIAFHKEIIQLGVRFEDAESRTPTVKGAGRTLSLAERGVVDAWNVQYGLKSPFMDRQVQKILVVGDFEFLRELTALVAHIRANGGASYRGVDIHPHALVGSLSGVTSYDFPFLNKTRLRLTNRGIWRVLFQGTRVYGIYDDHNGSTDKWKGEGLTRTPA